MLHRPLVGVVNLLRIVAAAGQSMQFVIAHVGDQLQQLRILAEEFAANVFPALRLVALIFAVDRLFHPLQENAGFVASKQLVPIGAPDHLDDVPAGAAKSSFQFLDDLAIAAHRAIEALQIAVHHEDQVVQLLARSQGQRTHRLGLVGLAIADERPHFALGLRNDAAILQIAHEARLIDRVERADTHRHRGESPEVGQQPGMRIRRQPRSAAQFVAEVLYLLFTEPAFQKSARVNAGRRVALEVNEVAGLIAVAGMEEVIEADLEQRGQRGVGRDVAADAGILLVLPMHHGHRVPADQALDAPLQLTIAGIGNFFLDRNGVDVGRVQLHRNFDTRLACSLDQSLKQFAAAVSPFVIHHLLEGL